MAMKMILGHRNDAEEQSPKHISPFPSVVKQSSSLAEHSLSLGTLSQTLRSIPRRLRKASSYLRSVPQALRNGLRDFVSFLKP